MLARWAYISKDAIPPLKAGVTVAHFHACGTCPTDINEVKIAESP